MTYLTRKFKNTYTKNDASHSESVNFQFHIAPSNNQPRIRQLPKPLEIKKPPVYDQHTGVILSMATIMNRVESFFEIIDSIDSIDRVFKVIIHLCKTYKRFNTEVADKDLKAVHEHPIIQRLNAKHGYDKYVVHIVDDLGPITKLIGVYQYAVQNKYTESKIVIIDDDTEYLDNCVTELVKYKTPDNIVSGSGFLFYENRNFTVLDETGSKKGTLNRADIVEGFSGICFQYSDLDPRFMQFVHYYRAIHWNIQVDEASEYHYRINTFLKACFLGDDFVISYYYGKKKKLYKVFGFIDLIKQQGYGYGADALHQNTVFQSNNGSYVFIYEHIYFFDALLARVDLCRHIREFGSFVLRRKPNHKHKK
jgi:hypothetical protein